MRTLAAERMPNHHVLMGCAAVCEVRAGHRDRARSAIERVLPVIEDRPPTRFGQSAAVSMTTNAVWELGAAEYAPVLRRVLEQQIAAGMGSAYVGVPTHTLARLQSLMGEHEEADALFEQARATESAKRLRTHAALALHDRALALMQKSAVTRSRIESLLTASRDAFGALEMPLWVETCEMRLQSLASRAPGRSRRPLPDGLTRREAEVLGLLAAGLANRDIAEHLVVSIHTVERHVANIYIKIDAHNRVMAAAYAAQHGLVDDAARTQ